MVTKYAALFKLLWINLLVYLTLYFLWDVLQPLYFLINLRCMITKPDNNAPNIWLLENTLNWERGNCLSPRNLIKLCLKLLETDDWKSAK